MAAREASRGLKCRAGAADDVGVKQRDETLRELYASSQASEGEVPDESAEPTSEESAATLTLTELVDEAPGLYGEAELRAAVQRESYGFQVSEEKREESAEPSGAISLPSGDSDAESLRICLVADTLGRK
jgi:hypothetical protein